MPCKDTTSKVIVNLDINDRLLNFYFSKITCTKEIGGETEYLSYCKGKTSEEILYIDYYEVLEILSPKNDEDKFFLYLEWDALRSSISQYLGHDTEIDHSRYQVASITCDESGVTISQVIYPPKEMPKLVSCFKKSQIINKIP